MNDVNVSKWLSFVLRHKPEEAGLTLDENGWVDVPTLIRGSKAAGKDFTLDQLIRVVETDDKKRYSFSNDGMIRASQGHSVKVDLGYTKETPPDYLYHGTASRFLDAIMKDGAKKMNRHHVHLSADKATAIKVGTRHGKCVVLLISARRMSRDGIKFYKSDNGVWLTDYIDPQYITIYADEWEAAEEDTCSATSNATA